MLFQKEYVFMKSKFLVLGAALSIMGAAVLASPAFAGVAGSGHSDAPNWGQHNGVEGTGHAGVDGSGHNAIPKCLELGCGGN